MDSATHVFLLALGRAWPSHYTGVETEAQRGEARSPGTQLISSRGRVRTRVQGTPEPSTLVPQPCCLVLPHSLGRSLSPLCARSPSLWEAGRPGRGWQSLAARVWHCPAPLPSPTLEVSERSPRAQGGVAGPRGPVVPPLTSTGKEAEAQRALLGLGAGSIGSASPRRGAVWGCSLREEQEEGFETPWPRSEPAVHQPAPQLAPWWPSSAHLTAPPQGQRSGCGASSVGAGIGEGVSLRLFISVHPPPPQGGAQEDTLVTEGHSLGPGEAGRGPGTG